VRSVDGLERAIVLLEAVHVNCKKERRMCQKTEQKL
jgi:hypothetical protein